MKDVSVAVVADIIKEEPEPELPAGFIHSPCTTSAPYSLEVVNGVYSFTVGPGENAIYTFEVPLADYSDTMKQVEVVQQNQTWLIVEVDRSCLYAMDKWKMVGTPLGTGMPVGSPQLEGHVCPHCCRSSF